MGPEVPLEKFRKGSQVRELEVAQLGDNLASICASQLSLLTSLTRVLVGTQHL